MKSKLKPLFQKRVTWHTKGNPPQSLESNEIKRLSLEIALWLGHHGQRWEKHQVSRVSSDAHSWLKSTNRFFWTVIFEEPVQKYSVFTSNLYTWNIKSYNKGICTHTVFNRTVLSWLKKVLGLTFIIITTILKVRSDRLSSEPWIEKDPNQTNESWIPTDNPNADNNIMHFKWLS